MTNSKPCNKCGCNIDYISYGINTKDGDWIKYYCKDCNTIQTHFYNRYIKTGDIDKENHD